MGFWSRAGQGFVKGFSSTFDVGRELRIQREMRRQKAAKEKDTIYQATQKNLQDPFVNPNSATGVLSQEEIELRTELSSKEREKRLQNIFNEVDLYIQKDENGLPIIDRIDPNRSKAVQSLIAKEINNYNALRKTYTPRIEATQEVTPARMGRISAPSGPSTMPDIDEFGNVQIRDTADEASVDYQLERAPGFYVEDTTVQKSNALLRIEDALNTLNTLSQRVNEYNNNVYKRGKARTGFDAFLAQPTKTELDFENFLNSVVQAQTNYQFVDDGLVDNTTTKNLENVALNIYQNQGLESAEAFLDKYKNKFKQADIIRDSILGMYNYREDLDSDQFAKSVLKSQISKLSLTAIDNSQASIHTQTINNSKLSDVEKQALIDIVIQSNENNIRDQQKEYNQLLRRTAIEIQVAQEKSYRDELKRFQRNNLLSQTDLRDENMQRMERPEYVPNNTQIKKLAEERVLELFPEYQVLKNRETYGRASVIAGTGRIVDGAISLYASRLQSGSVSMDESSSKYYETVVLKDDSLTLSEQQKVIAEISNINPELLRQEEENSRATYDKVQSYIPENDDYLNGLKGDALRSLVEVGVHFKKSFREDQELTTQDVAEAAHEYAVQNMKQTGQAAESIANFIVNYTIDRPAREMFITTGPTQVTQAETEEERTPPAISPPDSTRNVAAINRATEDTFLPPKRYGGGGPKKFVRDVKDVGRRIGDMLGREEDDQLIARFLREEYNIDRWSPMTQNAIQQQLGMTETELLNAAKKKYARQ